MALTTSKTYYRQQFGPLMPDVYVAPYPYCLHCKVRQASPSGSDWYKVRSQGSLLSAHLSTDSICKRSAEGVTYYTCFLASSSAICH